MRRFGLPKSALLRTVREFDAVYRQGRRLRGQDFTLICLGCGQEGSRLGISVPKQTGSAVRRNRIKRLVRETFRLHRSLFPEAGDLVFAVRPGFALNSLDEVRAAVAGLRRRPGHGQPA